MAFVTTMKIFSLVWLGLVSFPLISSFVLPSPSSYSSSFISAATRKSYRPSVSIQSYSQLNSQQPSIPTISAKTEASTSSTTILFSSKSESDQNNNSNSLRSVLRKLTGFSLTAFRISTKAFIASLRATLRAATGVSITGILHAFVGMFPLWARSFMQPFLILYYTPLIILRSMVGSTSTSREEARQAHEHFVDGLKEAVKVAEKVNKDGYWPVHVNEKGSIDLVSLPDPKDVDYLDAINKSVQLAASLSENGKDNSKAQNDASDFQI